MTLSDSVFRRRTAAWVLACATLLAARAPATAGSTPAASIPASPGAVLHLDDAIRQALSANWDVLASRDEAAIAAAGVRTAREFPNPSLSISTSRIHLDGRGDGTTLGNGLWERGYDSVAQLGQPIEIGGKRGARRGSAVAEADAARARLGDARRSIRAAVVKAYLGAALAQARADIARQSAGYLSDEARIAATRWEAGDISRSDRDQIEIAAARLGLEAESAEADARQQRIALELMLGDARPAGEVIVADSPETLADRADVAPGEPAAGERADLHAARAELRRAESELRLQRAERIPDPTLFAEAEHDPPDRPNSVGAGISLALPLWTRNAGAIAAARAVRDEAARTVARTEAQVASDVTAARVAYEEAAARWRRYRDELRPRSEEIRKSVSLAYEKGGASLLDLLEAQRGDNDVRLETAQAASDAATAAAALRSALQPLTPEDSRP